MNTLSRLLILPAILLAVCTAGHALLYKRDPRAALGWVAVCLVFPLFGPLLYLLFGINRIQIRARRMESRRPERRSPRPAGDPAADRPAVPAAYANIVRTSDALARWPVATGNRMTLLENGEQAFPAMLAAIDAARQRCFLCTYIFDTGPVGRRFVRGLARARGRGVEVGVIVDGVGELYARPRVSRLLKEEGVPMARFLPPRLLPPALHVNLRNHRKILTVDGHTAFTGGMNISNRHCLDDVPPDAQVADIHFRLQGPVARQVESAFLDDWHFLTGRELAPSAPAEPCGPAMCRAVRDGPNEELDRLATILVGAVSAARRSVSIMTPYFLPTRQLIGALQAAALRGVDVSVLLPEKSNLPPVHWAMTNMLWELLARGVRVFYQPPPFAHTKLFVVDDFYALIGSANLDNRSLRLNFELTVEIYGAAEARQLSAHFRQRLARSREVTLGEVDGRTIPVRVRDSIAWLFSPYM